MFLSQCLVDRRVAKETPGEADQMGWLLYQRGLVVVRGAVSAET